MTHFHLKNMVLAASLALSLAAGSAQAQSEASLAVSALPVASVVGVAGPGDVVVTFAAPAFAGGVAITGYTVTSSPAGGTDSNAGSTSLSHVITGLTNGTTYQFTGTVSGGGGVVSAPISATPVRTEYAGPVPGATGNAAVAITGGGLAPTLSWTVPDTTAPITNIRIQLRRIDAEEPGRITAATPAAPGALACGT